MPLDQQIEAVLFYKVQPMTRKELGALFEVDLETLGTAITQLEARLVNGATRLVATDEAIQLVIAQEYSDIIESIRKDDLRRDIGKAGAETLAIILYRGPISRAEIDKIRGVNSTFILRNLLIRGLIERRDNPKDQRSYLYAITTNLLNHLGISKREDLPEFSSLMNELDRFERDRAAMEESGGHH